MDIQGIHTFIKGVNKDISDEYLPNDTVRDSQNIIFGSAKDSEQGLIRNIRSNKLLLHNFELAEGDYTVIGNAVYQKEHGTIEFVYNSEGHHEIRAIINGVVTLVTRGSYLNFSLDYKIPKAKTYGDYLIWTDNRNDVRLLNIKWAKAYTNVMRHNEQTSGAFTVNTPINEYQEGVAYDRFIIYDGEIYYVFNDNPPAGGFYPKPPDESYYGNTDIQITSEMYRYLDSDTIRLIAAPPLSIPVAEYAFDSNFKMNNLYGDLYQFAYRYTYLDNRKSVWSHLSELPLPIGFDDYIGGVNTDTNNVIDIILNTGTKDVKSIDIGFKKASNTTSFNIIKTLNKYTDNGSINTVDGVYMKSNAEITWRGFYNNEQYIAVDISELYKAFDFIPKLSNNIDVMNEGRVVLIDNEIGINDIIPDVECSTIEQDITFGSSDITVATNLGYTISELPDVELDFVTLSLGALGYSNNYIFKCSFFFNGTTGNFRIPLDYDKFLNDEQNLRNAIIKITSTIRTWVKANIVTNQLPRMAYIDNLELWFDSFAYTEYPQAGYSPESIVTMIGEDYLFPSLLPSGYTGHDSFFITKRWKYHYYYGDDPWELSYLLQISDITVERESDDAVSYESLKRNSKINVGILYYDSALRHGSLQDIGSIVTSATPSLVSESSNDWYFKSIKPVITINHKPPIDAKYWKVVVTENNLYSDYIQFVVGGVAISGSNTVLEVNEFITESLTTNNNLYFQAWVWEKGDRIRHIAVADYDYAHGTGDTTKFTYDEYSDSDIILYDSANQYFTIKTPTTAINKGDVIEVYRPKKGVDSSYELYFDTGRLYEIGNDGEENRYHKGYYDTDQDQNGATPCIVTLNYGNCYIKKRITFADAAILEYVVESKHFSDFYKSDYYDKGRPINISVDLSRKRRDTHICFGGVIDITSNSNSVNVFDYEDYKDLNSSFGKVHGVVQIGYSLHVIQETKFVTFYVNRSVIQLADGGEQTVINDNVLNNMVVSEYDYGTKHRDSIIKRNTHALFFDATRGAFTRVATNGAFEISKYGYVSLAKQVAELSRQFSDFRIMGDYDEINNMYVWAWIYDGNKTGSACFRDEENVWLGGINMWNSENAIDDFGTYGDRIVAFVNGDAYLYDEMPASGNEYGELFGDAVESSVTIVFNKEPNNNKVLRTASLISEHVMLPSEDGDITCGDMTSLILVSNKVEDTFLLTFKRNTSTNTSGTYLEKLNYGEVLRGKSATIKFRGTNNLRNRVKFIKINSTLSEPSF